MKNTRLIAALALAASVATPALASEKVLKKSDLPAAVLKTVADKYPAAKMKSFASDVEDGKTEYEVIVSAEGGPIEVSVAADGKLLGEEQKLSAKDLPEAVTKGLAASKWAKSKILRVEKVTEADAPEAPVFELLVEQGGKKHEIVFAQNGELATPASGDKKD